MVCYALLCVFSRFALILMLVIATSMWDRRPLGSFVCGDLLCFITSRWGVLGQMLYLSVSVANFCILSYFKE